MKFSKTISVIVIIVVSVILVLLLQLTEIPILSHLSHLSLPLCHHVTLITAPRHGSTWLIDSAEGCPSRDTASDEAYRQLFLMSELWTKHQGPVYNITPAEATEYVTKNCSVKIFPSAKRQGEERVREFLMGVKENNVPVFVLRRRIEDAYGSFKDAVKTGKWSSNTGGAKKRDIELDEKFVNYQKKLDSFFEQLKALMWDVGIEWDELHYEDIWDQRRIVGQRNRCFIRNCNFT